MIDIPSVDRQFLIQGVSALTKQCLTKESAVKILSQMLTVQDVELPYDDKLKAVKLLATYGLITKEEAHSYMARLFDDQVSSEVKGMESSVRREFMSRNKKSGYSVIRMFGKGELRDAIISSIDRGNKTSKAIAQDLANRNGLDYQRVYATVQANLSAMSKKGLVQALESSEGSQYVVLEYDNVKQAKGFIDGK